jgi:hypothetical protein
VVAGIILAVIIVTSPEKQQSAGVVLAKLTVLVLVVVFLTRLAASPYLVYRQTADANEAEIKRLKDQIKTLSDENDEVARKTSIQKKLAEFLSEGQHWLMVCENHSLQIYPGDQIAKWGRDLDNYLTRELGNAYAIRVKSSQGILPQTATNLAPGLDQSAWWAIHVRCVRLNQFLEELS